MKKKHALLTSGLCLGLSAALLAGTTFAWFTDSVTNTGNRIEAGTLDVDLLMNTGSEYTTIANESGDIFDSKVLWEPGMTQVAYLAVENKGTLALEYDFLLNVTDDEKSLSSVLDYKIVDLNDADDKLTATTWGGVTGEAKDMTNGLNQADMNNKLVKDSIQYFALVVHMDENAGNQYKNAQTTIDVQVQARQTPEETDGFGKNDYDENAQGAYTDADDAKDALNSEGAGDVVVATDMTLDNKNKVNIIGDKNVNLSGTTVTNTTTEPKFTLGQRGNSGLAPVTAVVENGNFVSEKNYATVRVCSGSTVTFRNCTFTSAVNPLGGVVEMYSASDDITVVFENCTFEGKITMKGGVGYAINATFTDCTFPEAGLDSILTVGPNVEANITEIN